jgi:hypothetical protein
MMYLGVGESLLTKSHHQRCDEIPIWVALRFTSYGKASNEMVLAGVKGGTLW